MQSFLTKIRLFSFFNQLIFAYPIFSIMIQENGFNTAQLGLLLSVWAFTSLILEVPLGIVADKYSRKIVLIFGSLFKMLVFIVWIIFPSFYGYLLGFILWGISEALLSGTFEAFVYDELVKYKKESNYEYIMGGISSLSNIGIALALLFGGVLSELGYWFVLSLSSISSVVSMLLISSVKYSRPVSSTGESSLFTDVKDIIPRILKDRTLLHLSLVFILLLGLYGALDEFYPLLYTELDISKSLVGVLGMIGYMFASLGGWLISRERGSKWFNLIIVLVCAVVCYLGTFYFRNFVFIILHFPLATLFVMAEVNLNSRVQRYFKSSVRSTSISVLNMFKELVVIFIILIVGLVGVGNIWNTFLVGTIVSSVALILSLKIKGMVSHTSRHGS